MAAGGNIDTRHTSSVIADTHMGFVVSGGSFRLVFPGQDPQFQWMTKTIGRSKTGTRARPARGLAGLFRSKFTVGSYGTLTLQVLVDLEAL